MPSTFPYRILVVDDDENVLVTTAAMLSKEGYEVHIARDGFEALAMLRGSVPDLLISDLKMRNMSGFELLAVVRKRFPSIGVIAMTGEFSPASMPPSVLADRFLGKGDTPPVKLLEIVRELLAESPVRFQPAKSQQAPAWIPHSRSGYIVLTCPDCLRSFSVPEHALQTAVSATEICVHCGVTVAYCVDITVTAKDTDLSPVAESRKRVQSARKTIEQAKQMIRERKEKI